MTDPKESGRQPADSFQNQKMYIESLDLIKLYGPETCRMRIAVRVVDRRKKPVNLAEVSLMVKPPSGKFFDACEATRADGVAFFEISGVSSGRWQVGVTDVDHPEFIADYRDLLMQWRTARV